MKTPSGIECKYFYGDYYRGREREECRFLGDSWTKNLCRTCPVPAIDRANACIFMQLRGRVTHSLLSAFKARVRVTVSCEKTSRANFDPHIGCGECHPIQTVFDGPK